MTDHERTIAFAEFCAALAQRAFPFTEGDDSPAGTVRDALALCQFAHSTTDANLAELVDMAARYNLAFEGAARRTAPRLHLPAGQAAGSGRRHV
jgi:hypothetical protein